MILLAPMTSTLCSSRGERRHLLAKECGRSGHESAVVAIVIRRSALLLAGVVQRPRLVSRWSSEHNEDSSVCCHGARFL